MAVWPMTSTMSVAPIPSRSGLSVDYPLIDADNHYYEPHDVFTRHGEESVRRHIRWASEGKRQRLLFGDKVLAVPGNPTFSKVAKPGAFHDRLKELERGGERGKGGAEKEAVKIGLDGERFGELEPIAAAYQNRDERLAVLDSQGVERAFLFPTLGVAVEGLLADHPPMAYKAFEAFNRWVEDDWGFGYQDRIYAAPYVPLLDPELAVKELDRLIGLGARFVNLRPGPAAGRSPADTAWDPFWGRMDEAGIVAVYHVTAGPNDNDEPFNRYWGAQAQPDPGYLYTLKYAIKDSRDILDTLTALVLGNLFGRFPNLRVASIENGSSWVSYLLHTLDHAGGILERKVAAFGTRMDELPSEVFKRHVWISPFPEEDVPALAELIGSDRILFGSDWPHPEGTPAPADYLACLRGMDASDVRKIMRDNALSLLDRPSA